MKSLYLIRHGLSEMNVAGLVSGHTDTPLTDEGRAQAKAAGRQAKDLGIELIVSSPLIRAHETAKIIAREIDYPIDAIQTNSLLIERNHGAAEGIPWSPDLNLDGFADVETNDMLIARAKLVVDWLHTLDADTILVVSHGGIGRAIRHHVRRDRPFHHPERLLNAQIQQLI